MEEKSMEAPAMAKMSGGSGGGGNASKVRDNFQDLAFYRGTVNVVNGKATLTIDHLPDNLTTWAVVGYAITPESKV